jgi:probable H4MPT-linked C1 transfer pathway protein
MSAWVCGWDIGGAHLKLALRDPAGRWIAVRQLPCPLWQGIEKLAEALRQAVRDWPVSPQRVLHAATMTGELVDAFPGRAAGVAAIVGCSESAFPGANWRWFNLDGLLVDGAEAHRRPLALASANWLASASCAARSVDGLFIDIGSTTTDIVALSGGAARPRGLTDGERLSAGELVYRGIVRTPLMAVADSIDWRGTRRPLMAEHFATTADVFRLSGDLDEAADAWPAADGGDKTVEGSARRIARLLGEDLESASLEQWRGVAAQLAEAMIGSIAAAASRVLTSADGPVGRKGQVTAHAATGGEGPVVVCAGAAHWLAARIAARLGLPAVDFAALIGAVGVPGAREHAPALALAERIAGDSAAHHTAG